MVSGQRSQLSTLANRAIHPARRKQTLMLKQSWNSCGPCPREPMTPMGLENELRTWGFISSRRSTSCYLYVCCACATCGWPGCSRLWLGTKAASAEHREGGTGRTQSTLQTWLVVSRAYLTSPSVRCQIPIPCCRSGGLSRQTDCFLRRLMTASRCCGQPVRALFFCVIPILRFTILWSGSRNDMFSTYLSHWLGFVRLRTIRRPLIELNEPPLQQRMGPTRSAAYRGIGVEDPLFWWISQEQSQTLSSVAAFPDRCVVSSTCTV